MNVSIDKSLQNFLGVDGVIEGNSHVVLCRDLLVQGVGILPWELLVLDSSGILRDPGRST